MTQNSQTPAQGISQQLVQSLARELKDLVLDYVLPGSQHDLMEIWNHRFLRFLECMEAYLDEPSDSKESDPIEEAASSDGHHTTYSIWRRLDTGKNLPLDRWYLDPVNVAADKKVYNLMKAEVFKCLKFIAARRAAQRVPDRPILPDLNVEGIPQLDPVEPRGPEDLPQPIQPITEAVRWWRGTNTYGKFRYWSRYVGLPFHIYKQMKIPIPCEDGEEECIYDDYLFDVGPLYGLPESLETTDM
jgi:hypothetical protein